MNNRAPIVFLVDDDAAVRDSLSLLIESAGYKVEAHADAETFLAACSPEMRGCVITDLRMPGMDGRKLQIEMALRGYPVPIIFLSGYGDIPTTVKAIKDGAVDFLTKPVDVASLVRSIAAAFDLDARRQSRAGKNRDHANRIALLTSREQDVMRLAVEGLSNKEIAQRLGISHRTVEIHKAHVMKKTGAANLIELTRIAREGGVTA